MPNVAVLYTIEPPKYGHSSMIGQYLSVILVLCVFKLSIMQEIAL